MTWMNKYLGSYLHRIGAADTDIYDYGKPPGTVEYFLFQCTRWAYHKQYNLR
jgi:hypothetical protein